MEGREGGREKGREEGRERVGERKVKGRGGGEEQVKDKFPR